MTCLMKLVTWKQHGCLDVLAPPLTRDIPYSMQNIHCLSKKYTLLNPSPLGELTASPDRPSSWIYGERKNRGGEKEREGMEEEDRGGKGRVCAVLKIL